MAVLSASPHSNLPWILCPATERPALPHALGSLWLCASFLAPAGMAASKKWKYTVRIQQDGRPIGTWLEIHGYAPKAAQYAVYHNMLLCSALLPSLPDMTCCRAQPTYKVAVSSAHQCRTTRGLHETYCSSMLNFTSNFSCL